MIFFADIEFVGCCMKLYGYDECVKCLVLLFGCKHATVAGRSVAGFVALTQARLTRPGETCRSRLGVSRTLAKAESSGF